LAPNTVNRRLAGLRVFLGWAVEAGHISVNPGARIRGIQVVEPAPRWLDRSEQHRLVNELEREVQAAQASRKRSATPDTASASHDRLTAALRDRAIVMTLLHTGLRVLELVQLATRDITLSERKGLLIVRDGKEVNVHSLRHTFGKNLADAGVSLDQVATLMGHANLNTTRRYTTPGVQDLQRAVERVVK
jgi:integrase/recombinase XerC